MYLQFDNYHMDYCGISAFALFSELKMTTVINITAVVLSFVSIFAPCLKISLVPVHNSQVVDPCVNWSSVYVSRAKLTIFLLFCINIYSLMLLSLSLLASSLYYGQHVASFVWTYFAVYCTCAIGFGRWLPVCHQICQHLKVACAYVAFIFTDLKIICTKMSCIVHHFYVAAEISMWRLCIDCILGCIL